MDLSDRMYSEKQCSELSMGKSLSHKHFAYFLQTVFKFIPVHNCQHQGMLVMGLSVQADKCVNNSNQVDNTLHVLSFCFCFKNVIV